MLKPVLAGLAISSLCLALTADLFAQGGKAPRPPAAEPLRIVKLSPELEKVLKDWEFHTSQFKTMTVEFTRFKYDHTYEVEKRAEGKVIYAAPDKGNYEIRGMKIDKDEVSGKVNKNGDPYALKSDVPERWVCTGKEVIQMDENARPKTYEKMSIPPESQGQNIIDGPLPFLFGMKADRAKSRYSEIKLLKSKEGEIKLHVRSKEKQDATHWETAVIIIDAKEFTPKAVKLTDVTGAESVHVFKNVVVNARKPIFGNDPFNPSLRGYKQILPPTDSPPSKAVSGKSPAGPRDHADLGRTADSAADNPARKKAATVNRK